MLIRCINREFRDLKSKGKPVRKPGDEWEAPPERLAEINRGRYGVMAEPAEPGAEGEPAETEPDAAPAPKRRARGKKADGE